MSNPQLDEVLSRLSGVKRSGGKWMAVCPSHDDSTASLSLSEGDEARVVMKCMAGCTTEEVLESIGLEWTDLFEESNHDEWIELARFDYRDEQGTLLFRKTKYRLPNGKKTFVTRHLDDKGNWQKGMGDAPRVLYNLPAVRQKANEGGVVILVEGESDADRLIELGHVATTMPNGADHWLSIHTEALRGAAVFIIGDRDRVGKLHVAKVRDLLDEGGVYVAKIKEPPAPHKDVSNLLDAGGQLSDLVAWEPAKFILDDAIQELITLRDSDREEKIKIAKAERIITKLTVDDIVLPTAHKWDKWLDDNPSDDYLWVIENLIEESERVILVGFEGAGKSTLSRQMAIMAACGIHPFRNHTRIPTVRTLTVDLENPGRIIRRKTRELMAMAKAYSGNKDPQAFIDSRPEGINILTPQGREYIELLVEEYKPQIMFIGPIYKAYLDPGGRSNAAIATEMIHFLDYIRTEYKTALWIEMHAPMANTLSGRELRPSDSSLWMRWPEFGLALTQVPTEPGVYELGRFRGDRDERQFPEKIARGGRGNFPFITV